MKKILLTFLFSAFANLIFAQDFITRWNMSYAGPIPTQLSFGVGTTGICNYTWQTIPAGANGSGTFSGNTLTITGLPANAIIQLNIDTTNFNRIQINKGQDTARLVDVQQWGGVHWVSMQDAFSGCWQTQITATDIPDLSAVYSLERMFKACTLMTGPTNINAWNTSNVTNIKSMFCWAALFNQPIENLNTANVTIMDSMFYSAIYFNQPIGNWNTTNVTSMVCMFGCDISSTPDFNQPIGNWNTGSVTNMSHMFDGAKSFNQPLSNWNTTNVTNMSWMFASAYDFNQPIGTWNTMNVTDMRNMFNHAGDFNQPIGNWNTINVTNMSNMFSGAGNFNQPIGNWNTSNVANMGGMFGNNSSFNQPLDSWNTSSVTNMTGMFGNTHDFNQPLGNWNTSNVENMSYMFSWAKDFNQPIGNWNTANVTDMTCMFNCSPNFGFITSFNQPIGNWNTTNVTNMNCMFRNAQNFNQSLNTWNTSSVTDMRWMFLHATNFNQTLANWQLNPNVDLQNMLDSCGMDCASYSATLSGWSANISTPQARQLGASGLQYFANAQSARDSLVNIKGWTITGDFMTNGPDCWPLNSSEIGDKRDETLEVYPNPASTRLYTKTESKELRTLFNSVGQLLISTPENEIEVSNYPSGVYYLKCGNQTKKVLIE